LTLTSSESHFQIKALTKRWFPTACHEQISRILWNLTAYPAGNQETLERQLCWVACRTMPELPGFDDRIDEAIEEALHKMDKALEGARRMDDAAHDNQS